MKKFWMKPLFAGLFLIAFNQSCTNLDENVYDTLSADKFFKTEEDFVAALGAAYTRLYGFQNHNSYMSVQEISSDEAMIPQRGGDWFDGGQWLRAHRHEYTPNDEGLGNAWNYLYGGVNDCNRLIFQFEKLIADGAVDRALAEPFISELRTLRAMWYLFLLDGFGNVPIVDKFDVPKDFAPANNTRAQVYAFVESELSASVPKLSKAKNQSTYGRMSYYAGQAILAKLYLNAQVYKGGAEWDKCIAACDQIIGSGLYSLESDYFNNFNVNNAGSSENILSIPYDQVFAQGFNLPQMTLHYGSQATFKLQQQPWNGYCSLQEFYESYADGDKRKGISGNQKIRGNFHAGPQYEADGVTPIKDSGADDPDGPNLVFTPQINEHFPNAHRQAGVRVGKYEFQLGATPNLSVDYPIFRYADVLLMRAEALWRKNPADATALVPVNQIRARAGQPAFASLTADNLLAERGREMFFEAWRRQDLIRFGVFGNARRWQPASDKNKELWPIPRAVLDANKNLKQNPGY